MARTIVYDRPRQPDEREASVPAVYAQRGDATTSEDEDTLRGDTYAERLLKYIPAETIAFVVFGSSFSDITDAQLVAVLIIAAVGQLGWIYREGQKLRPVDRPAPRQYVFAFIAFCAWTLGTASGVREMLGVDDTTAAIVLGGAAYLLPMVDPAAHEKWDPKAPEQPRVRR